MGAASCCSAGRFAGFCSLYGGRVVPFRITRSSAAQTSQVQDVTSGAVTYGHRFLTTSGRAGRAIKVRTFDDYRARLLENFVILERSERHDKIARGARCQSAALARAASAARSTSDAGLLEEVPDLVEYPSVIAGTFASEFTEVLPDEVLTTTLIHHQHYFPGGRRGRQAEDRRFSPSSTPSPTTSAPSPATPSASSPPGCATRCFFWEADRRTTLESRIERLSTLLFHKRLGTLQDEGRAHRAAGAGGSPATRSAPPTRTAAAGGEGRSPGARRT